MTLLKREAKEHKTSVNLLILKFVEQGIGFSGKTKRTLHHELDSLSGTWTMQDKKDFDENVQSFETIDKDLWT